MMQNSYGPATENPQNVISLEEVQKSQTLCIIDGKVVDLSAWFDQHPGGPDRIKALVGTDASARFAAKHGNSKKAKEQLQKLVVASLGKIVDSASGTASYQTSSASVSKPTSGIISVIFGIWFFIF